MHYPKPFVLDKKWKIRDINLAKQTNIPKFSKLDDIGTPLKLFELSFDDALVDMIAGYTKLHGHKEKAETSSEITN